MLDLVRTFTGCPTGPLNYLVLPRATFIVCELFYKPTGILN